MTHHPPADSHDPRSADEGYTVGYPDPGAPAPATEFKRPGTVLAGCVMAWVGSAVGLAFGTGLLLVSESSSALDGVDVDVNRADLVDALRISGGVLVLWCLVVLVLAVFAFRGARWAAIGVVVAAGLAALLGLVVLASGSGQLLLALFWSVASAALVYLNRPAKQWYASRSRQRAAAES